MRRWMLYRRARCAVRVVLVLVLILLFVLEEVYIGTAYTFYANQYDRVLTRRITKRRADAAPSIVIVVIVADTLNAKEYSLSRATVSCYAEHHGYPLKIVDASRNETFNELCPQRDFMFKRHCVLSYLMASWPYVWILFLDADMGVVNPNHLIEEYLPTNDSVDLVFYDRIFNYEVMAGSYIARNSNFSRSFLRFWGDYTRVLPYSFHGTDNGALHSVLVEFTLPSMKEKRLWCEEFWIKSDSYRALFKYEACMRELMKEKTMSGIQIVPKNGRYWARDGWLTSSVWSPRDFIFHGWQTRRLDRPGFARWHSPLVGGAKSFDQSRCANENAYLNWQYKDTFMTSDDVIEKKLVQTILNVRREYDEVVQELRREMAVK